MAEDSKPPKYCPFNEGKDCDGPDYCGWVEGGYMNIPAFCCHHEADDPLSMVAVNYTVLELCGWGQPPHNEDVL